MTVGGLLLLLSRRLEWIKPSFPFIGSRRIEIPVGDISCLAMITIACIPIVPIKQMQSFGHVTQSRIHQIAAVIAFGLLPAAVCRVIFQRLHIISGTAKTDNRGWREVGVDFEVAAKRTRCLVPFFSAGGAVVSFLSWQISERLPAVSARVPHIFAPMLLTCALFVLAGWLWLFTLQMTEATFLWTTLIVVLEALELSSADGVAVSGWVLYCGSFLHLILWGGIEHAIRLLTFLFPLAIR